VRTTVSLKQSARIFKNRFLGSPHLLQGSLLAYPVAAGAAMVAVEATASPEVSQMAPGQVCASNCCLPGVQWLFVPESVEARYCFVWNCSWTGLVVAREEFDNRLNEDIYLGLKPKKFGLRQDALL
jgi:hypothetical protein